MAENDEQPKKPGPDEEQLKLDMDWEETAKEFVKKEKPEDGWPDQDNNSDYESERQ